MGAFFTIRTATRSDLGFLVTLLKQLFSIESDFEFDLLRQKKGLELLLESLTATILVAEENGAVVGMATGQIVISTAEGCSSLLVEDVVVNKQWQKKGAGTGLLRAIGDWGRAHGAGRMQLLADSANSEAHTFYHKNGWNSTSLVCLRSYC